MSHKGVPQTVLEHFARGVPAARERFDGKTGRFLHESGGWAVTNQDVILPLALLCKTPGTPCHEDPEIMDLALRGGDALRNWQDDDGRFEFIKVDGSRWGMTYMPWSMYHWVETYGLLRDDMDAERRARWETGLRLCFNGTAREFETSDNVHNIPCWHGMALTRAGQLFDDRRWSEVGARTVLRHVEAQHPDGYWPEGGGPTTLYNLIYTHAIGLYHLFTADESVLPCLQRALDFHLLFTYPDGAAVETVDGRVRYHDTPLSSGYPGFLPFPRGRRFARWLVDEVVRAQPEGGLLPRLAPAVMHWPGGPEEPIPQEQTDFAAVHCGHALVRRRGPWFYCLSGYLTPTDAIAKGTRVRWLKDRQNYLSVWHERTGLVVGGGNSKHQPECSTFEVIAGRVARLQADDAAPHAGDDADRLVLTYGATRCELAVRVIDDDNLELTFDAPESGDDAAAVRAGFTLPGLAGKTLVSSVDDAPHTLDNQESFGHSFREPGGRLRIGAVELDLPGDATFAWPVYPHNPYAIDNTAPPKDAVGVICIALTPGAGAKTIRLTVTSECER